MLKIGIGPMSDEEIMGRLEALVQECNLGICVTIGQVIDVLNGLLFDMRRMQAESDSLKRGTTLTNMRKLVDLVGSRKGLQITEIIIPVDEQVTHSLCDDATMKFHVLTGSLLNELKAADLLDPHPISPEIENSTGEFISARMWVLKGLLSTAVA